MEGSFIIFMIFAPATLAMALAMISAAMIRRYESKRTPDTTSGTANRRSHHDLLFGGSLLILTISVTAPMAAIALDLTGTAIALLAWAFVGVGALGPAVVQLSSDRNSTDQAIDGPPEASR